MEAKVVELISNTGIQLYTAPTVIDPYNRNGNFKMYFQELTLTTGMILTTGRKESLSPKRYLWDSHMQDKEWGYIRLEGETDRNRRIRVKGIQQLCIPAKKRREKYTA